MTLQGRRRAALRNCQIQFRKAYEYVSCDLMESFFVATLLGGGGSGFHQRGVEGSGYSQLIINIILILDAISY